MKRIILSAVIFIFLCAHALYAKDGPEPLTLEECYNLSLVQSETVAIDGELIKQADAHFVQALGTILPHLSFSSQDSQQDSLEEEGSTGTFRSLSPTTSSERKFVLTQTLFRGFKEFAAMKGGGFERKQRISEKTRAEQLLLVDVSNAFYLIAELKEDLNALHRIRAALLNRITELKSRERIGRSRTSEVVNAKVQFYDVEALTYLVQSQKVIAGELLEFLTGVTVYDIKDQLKPVPALREEGFYTAKINKRPDVEAAKHSWELYKTNVIIADSGFLPEVNFLGNWYVQRTGFNKNADWDVMLEVDIPIFEGTEVYGSVTEAMSQERASALAYSRTKRMALYDIREAYTALQTTIVRHEAFRKSLKAAELNYRLQKIDYQRSLVSNLDVLAAIQTWQNAERDYIHASYEAQRAYWRLCAAVGEARMGRLNDAF